MGGFSYVITFLFISGGIWSGVSPLDFQINSVRSSVIILDTFAFCYNGVAKRQVIFLNLVKSSYFFDF